jgi:hypothetical protein
MNSYSSNKDLSFLDIIKKTLTLRKKGTCRSKNKFGAVAVAIDRLNEIDVELDWIQGLKEQAEFLNANMKHYSILFKVQRREFVTGGSN